MKRLIGLWAFMSLSFFTLAQPASNLVPVVIVTTHGDTVSVLTEPSESYGGALKYWVNGIDKPRTYVMKDIRAFVTGSRYFEQVPFGSNSLMLEAVATGAIKLFAYRRLSGGQLQPVKPGAFPEDVKYRLFLGTSDNDIDASNFKEVILGLKIPVLAAAVSQPDYKYSDVPVLISSYNRRIRMARTSRIVTVRVLDEETHKPIRDAEVKLATNEGTVKTSASGFFELNIDTIKTITITHPEYEPSSVKLPMGPPQLTVVLSPKWIELPTLINLVPGGKTPQEDSLARKDLRFPSIHWADGWNGLYTKLESRLRSLGSVRTNPEKPLRIEFVVDTDGQVKNIKAAGVTDEAFGVVNDLLSAPGNWEVKPSEVGVWRFVIKDQVLVGDTGDEVYTVVEVSAVPVGGMQAFYSKVARDIRYPAEARRKGIEGRVFVEFVIQTDGTLSDLRAIVGIGGGCDEEAVRVVSQSDKWLPGTQRGKAVKQRYTLPIIFRLSGPGRKR